MVVLGRTGRTEFNFPVTATAAAVNLGLNLLLVPPYGLVGAGLSLVGAYLVMLALMYAITRRLFPVPFQWGRLLRIVAFAGGLFAAGEALLPTAGVDGFASRAALVVAYPILLYASGFLEAAELAGLRVLSRRLRAGRSAGASGQAAQDLKSLSGRAELMDDVHDA